MSERSLIIDDWDRGPWYHARQDGSFGFVEGIDGEPPITIYDVVEARPTADTGWRQFPAAYSNLELPAIEQAQQGEQS